MTAPNPNPLLTGLRIGECAALARRAPVVRELGRGGGGRGRHGWPQRGHRSGSTAAIRISIDWLADGRLLVVSGPEGSSAPGGRRVAGRATPTCAASRRIRWNEIVVDGRGNVYVNTINFDFMGGGEFAPG